MKKRSGPNRLKFCYVTRSGESHVTRCPGRLLVSAISRFKAGTWYRISRASLTLFLSVSSSLSTNVLHLGMLVIFPRDGRAGQCQNVIKGRGIWYIHLMPPNTPSLDNTLYSKFVARKDDTNSKMKHIRSEGTEFHTQKENGEVF